MVESVSVQEIVEDFDLQVYSGQDYLDRSITTSDVSRPALEITGYFNYYPAERLQLIGLSEHSYLKAMTSEERLSVMERLAQKVTPAFIFSRNLEPFAETIQAAEAMNIPVLGSAMMTTSLLSTLSSYLSERLSKRESVHGVLVDVYGMGVLMQGKSGIGKSETALELIKKGHRLVADDRVDLHFSNEFKVIGEAPEVLFNMIEIRGLGIINVLTLFGTGAVKKQEQLDLIIYLEDWDQDKDYDRLGTDQQTVEIFGIKIPKLTIPIRPGRNVSNMVEVSAMNLRAQKMGYNSAKEFQRRLDDLMAENAKKNKKEKEEKDGD